MSMPMRKLTTGGLEAPLLGLGAMRFPSVEQETVTAIIKRAVELGVKYIETCPRYGDSEEKIANALEELDCRDRVYISTKSAKRTGTEMRADLEQSLKQLRMEHLDFYHMWRVSKMDSFRTLMGPGGALAEAKKARDEGVFDHLGITTHAKYEEVKEMVDTGEFELITLYYNASDAAVGEAVEYAHEKGLGVVTMGPLKGGFLATGSEKMAFLRDEHAETNAQGAIRWLAANPGVSVIPVGYTRVKEVEEAYAAVTTPPMSDEKRSAIVDGIKALGEGEDICSGCGYCMEHCPEKVPIRAILTCLTRYEVYEAKDYAHRRYEEFGTKADACVQCGECLEHCPQKLDIPALLEKTHSLLGKQPS